MGTPIHKIFHPQKFWLYSIAQIFFKTKGAINTCVMLTSQQQCTSPNSDGPNCALSRTPHNSSPSLISTCNNTTVRTSA